MPLFLIVPVAAAISLSLAIFFFHAAATEWLPLFVDMASLGHGGVYVFAFGVYGSIFYAIVTMLGMATALCWTRRERAIKIAMVILLAPVALMLLPYTIEGINTAQFVVTFVLIVIPLVLTVVAQWFLLRLHLRRTGRALGES